MQRRLDLERLERKAWTSFHQDGALETYLGLLLLIAFVTAGDSPYLRVVGPVLLFSGVGLFFTIRRLVTAPRLGIVRFGPKRQAKRRKTAAIMGLVVVMTVVLLAATAVGRLGWSPSQTTFGVSLGIGIWAVFAAIGYLTDYRRLYAVGFVFSCGVASRELFDAPVLFLPVGSVLLAYGLVLFLRFLRAYPPPRDSELQP